MSTRCFSLGQVVMTCGVRDTISEDINFSKFVITALHRHANGDWGDMCEEDKAYNEYALDNGDRLFSSYKNGDTKIWIITEWDRSVTTILFPSEY